MRFEVKTDNEINIDPIKGILLISLVFFLIIILTNISIQLSKLGTYKEINYLCNLFSIEKSSFNFKRLSKLTKQTSKNKMWDLCQKIIE